MRIVSRLLPAALILSLMFTSGCTTKQPDPYDYTKLIASNPSKILVMMPTNGTNNIEAAAAALATSVMPLAQAGYYVFPVSTSYLTFKSNGVTEGYDIQKIPYDKIREVFDADAGLYLNVTDYGSTYGLLDTYITVGIEAKLIDLKTGSLLWNKKIINRQSSTAGQSGLLEMLIVALISQIVSNVTDTFFDTTAATNRYLLFPNKFASDPLLYGPKHPKFRQDPILKRIQELEKVSDKEE